MLRSLIVVAVVGGVVRADAIDPAKLDAIAVKPGTADTKAKVFTTGVDAVQLFRVLSRQSFVAPVGGKRVVGRFGDVAGDGVPVDAVIAAVADGLAITTPSTAGKGKPVDFDFADGAAPDLLRLCAEIANADFIIAPGHALPRLVVRLKRVPVEAAAIAIATAAGLELVERGDVWTFLEPKTKLDARRAAATTAGTWIEVRAARAGEVRMLLDDKDTGAPCPDHEISAKLRHGETGLLGAVARTFSGPACAGADDIDLDAAQLIGTFTGPKVNRGVLRHNGKSFALATESESYGHGTMHAMLGGEKSLDPAPTSTPVSHPFTDATAGHWKLVATLAIGVVWQAIFEDGSGLVHVLKRERLGQPDIAIDIDARHAWTTSRSFALSR